MSPNPQVEVPELEREPLLGRVLSATATGLFAGALVVGLACTLWIGWGYYALPRAERELSHLHPLLAAGAQWGVTMGVLGTVLMLVMNLYTVRKKMMFVRWLGPMSGWLRFHILCGIFGPLFIVMHAGLTWPVGLIAVGFWCMALVALSGTFGRYVYGLLPRASGGGALGLHQAREELADLHARIVAETAEDDVGELGALLVEFKELEIEANSFGDLLRGLRLYGDRRRRIRYALAAADLDGDVEGEVKGLLMRQLRLVRGLELSQVARRLLRYWHLFHRPLAGAMYAIVTVHVVGAILFGGSLQQVQLFWEGVSTP